MADPTAAGPNFSRPLRVLLFAEAVTLAHVARPIALARALAPLGYELMLACDRRYAVFSSAGPWRQADLHSIPSAQFNSALAKGTPVYDLQTLHGYVNQDLALIESFKPDLVVGDFRLSLSVSARLARVPYLAISNAYWSPHYLGGYALPVLPLSRTLPIPLATALFTLFRPLAFALHCRPMNRLRLQHGLPSLGHNLRRVYTDADHLLIPDVAPLYRLDEQACNYSYLGPLMWSPTMDPPHWWNEPIPAGEPTVYVTLGSSGDAAVLPLVLEALKELPVRVMASTAGSPPPANSPANARLAPYLPGDEAAERSQLMICNGGSLSTQQALAAGIPILALASNMDQFLNMEPIEQAGAGHTLRADRLSVASIREAAQALLASNPAKQAAGRLQPMLDSSGVGAAFDAAASKLLSASSGTPLLKFAAP